VTSDSLGQDAWHGRFGARPTRISEFNSGGTATPADHSTRPPSVPYRLPHSAVAYNTHARLSDSHFALRPKSVHCEPNECNE
jgi:hypothetical protein